MPRRETQKQRLAARRNLIHARAVEAHRPRTARQRAAARANLVRARNRPRTAKQRAASRANLVKARAAARHRPRTAAQKAAARRNLIAANHRRHLRRKKTLKHHRSRLTHHRSTVHTRRRHLAKHPAAKHLKHPRKPRKLAGTKHHRVTHHAPHAARQTKLHHYRNSQPYPTRSPYHGHRYAIRRYPRAAGITYY